MDGLMTYLVAEARAQGVEWFVQDGQLHLRGPRAAEPIVQQLLARKEELRALLMPRACEVCGANAGSGVKCSPCAAAAVGTPPVEPQERDHGRAA